MVCRWQATLYKGAEERKKKKRLVFLKHKKLFLFKKNSALTKYVVGAKAKPPKNPRRPPKKGKVIPTNIVNAATEKK